MSFFFSNSKSEEETVNNEVTTVKGSTDCNKDCVQSSNKKFTMVCDNSDSENSSSEEETETETVSEESHFEYSEFFGTEKKDTVWVLSVDNNPVSFFSTQRKATKNMEKLSRFLAMKVSSDYNSCIEYRNGVTHVVGQYRNWPFSFYKTLYRVSVKCVNSY